LHAQFYNGTQVDFGKNRVQYDAFEWQFYRFPRFETYFYTGGKKLAVHTANYANKRIPELEKFLDFYLDEQIQFIVYNKQSHFRQSNIGLSTNENYNVGGVTRIVDSKVFIYFEGDYRQFERQIDAGILRVLIYQMIYGGNWKDVLRNSALASLPEWYIDGLVSYLTEPNNPLVNARIKDGILNGDFKRFNSLNSEAASVAGHAMWRYIAETYGQNVISNILYMTRMSREIDDGFLYVIGVPFEDLYDEWVAYYKGEYLTEARETYDEPGNPVEFKIRKNRRYQNFTSSRDGRYIAYSTNKMGQYKIFLFDKTNGKTHKILKKEHQLDRIQDYSYPLVEWHPSNKYLSFITEEKGEIRFYTYDIEGESLAVKPIFKMEKILSYNYLPDGRRIIFSGLNEGQSDLYLYNVLGNTQNKLTDDLYDDLDPIVSPDGKKIFFISNRQNDSLNLPHEVNPFLNEKDLFVYEMDQKETPIRSVTNTDDIDESKPLILGDKVYYSVNKKGETERFAAQYDSAVSKIDTAIHYRYFYESEKKERYNRNIIEQSSNQDLSIDQISYSDGRYALYNKQTETQQQDLPTESNQNQENAQEIFPRDSKESFIVFEEEKVEREVDIYNYQFSNSVSKKAPSPQRTLTSTNANDITPLEFPTQRLYRLNFKADNSVLQLNNTFINSQYQLFNGGPYINSGLGVNTKVGIVDLMEDHRIYGGFRYAGDLIEYSLSYQNLKKRLDKEYMISRTRERVTGRSFNRGSSFIPEPFDVKTIRGVASYIWPFSEVTSLRTVFSLRNDRVIPLSSDRFNLETDILNEFWASSKVAYVYDNSRNVALNIRYGTRFKVFGEYYKMVYSGADDSPSSDLVVLGLDYRHYQKIHREFIFVSRFAASTSFGSNPLIYYLGGVNEWWKSDIFDESTPIDYSQNYGFQALAANMRGFLQNIRNGSNFAVMNYELRLPVFAYFINRPIQSDFVRNFQIVGFADIGTAWTGTSPFDDDNPLNNETYTTGPITVTYENINDPIVGGSGFGLRTTLLGYFVRADWAWGIENGEISKKSQFIFSLSLDI
jgi:Tol biopolymer transport system component